MSNDRESQLDTAVSAIQKGELDSAARLCRELLQQNPNDAEAWSFYGVATVEKDQVAGLSALHRAVELQPREPRWHINLGICLGQCHLYAEAETACGEAYTLAKGDYDTLIPWADSLTAVRQYQQAADILQQALSQKPLSATARKLSFALANVGDPLGAHQALNFAVRDKMPSMPDQLNLARLDMQLQWFEKAADRIEALLETAPDNPDVANLAAEHYRSQGRAENARAVLEQAYAQQPDNTALIINLLKEKSPPVDVLSKAETQFADESRRTSERRTLAFTLAQYFDQANLYDRAWSYAKQANRLYGDGVQYVPEKWQRHLAAAVDLYQRSEIQEHEGPRLIYLLGTPRSGGTLLQSLLAAAPEVASVGERGALLPWLLRLLDLPEDQRLEYWNQNLLNLSRADVEGLRKLVPALGTIVDKTSHHAHVAGLLKRLHGNAVLINNRREPLDVMVSIYLRDFPAAFDYSRRIEDIADHLQLHDKAIDLWRSLGLPMIDHDHDEFITNPRVRAQALFAQLDIQWQDTYLEPGNRNAVVHTFSQSQVREPVSKTSSNWLNYREFMSDLAGSLESRIER